MPDRIPVNNANNTPPDSEDDYSSEIRLDHFTTDIHHPNTVSLKTLSLVLTARGITCRLIPAKKSRRLMVKSHDMAAAEHEISLYLAENKTHPQEPEKFYQRGDNTLQTVSALLLLGIFHNLTYFNLTELGYSHIDWLQQGRADAILIRNGEWWRTITALTLHVDGQHLISNLLIGGYFVVRLCRMLGSGLGWSLILWAGILGNTINALMHSSGHRSIGASTALFGAIGIAGMIGLMRQRRTRSRYAVLPFAAAVGLLAMLGAGNGDAATDIGAHLFGFASGLVLGAGASWWVMKHGLPTARTDRLLAFTAIATPILAWVLALSK